MTVNEYVSSIKIEIPPLFYLLISPFNATNKILLCEK